VLVGLYLLFGHRLAARDLWSSHEARAAMDAQTILDTGAWGLPRLFDGTPELQKPPLYYWLVAGVAWLRGGPVDAWSVRLPALLAALGCLGLLAGFGWQRGRLLAGALAAAVLATALHFTWLARIGRIDMPLTLAVGTAIVSFSLAWRQPAGQGRFGLLFLGYLALAAGVMLKGPIGVVLPAAVLVMYGMVERRYAGPAWRPVLGLWWGVPLVAALTLPWFFWANAATDGAFFRVFFWYHNVERGLGGSRLRGHPWWFYGPQLAVDFLPWSPLLAVAGWWCWRRRLFGRDPEVRLGLVWLLTVLAVLSCARFKRADYLLPAYPGAALFLGCVLGRTWDRPHTSPMRQRRRHWALAGASGWCGVGVISVACALGWLAHVEWVLPRREPELTCRPFAAEVRRLAPVPAEVVLFRAEDHLLAFHLGRPLTSLIEYRHLADRLQQPGTQYVVMPPEWLDECRRLLPHLALEEIARSADLGSGRPDRPLVLLRSGTSFKR
jgi:4-amino-4-deoxy-L-arabinose transferase-like glycosyltransferase